MSYYSEMYSEAAPDFGKNIWSFPLSAALQMKGWLCQETVNDKTERKGNHQAGKDSEPAPDSGLNLILAQDQHDTESECGNDKDQVV